MRIAFVFAPFSHRKFEEDIVTVSRDFGVYPPMGLAYAAGIAERHGHKVILIDANALKLTKEQVLTKLKSFRPDALGFMLTTYMFRLTHAWIRFFKQEMPDVKIITGNIQLELYPLETLSHKEIDFGIVGPATKNFPLLLKAIESKDWDGIDAIPGLAYRKNGSPTYNPPETLKEDWDALPRLPRHLLPNERYFQFISQQRPFTLVLTSKGCPYKCTFCSLGKSPFSQREIPDVIAEVRECVGKYHVKEIDFFEALFTFNKIRTINLCKAILKNKLRFEWACRSRVDTVDDETLGWMSRAGCRRIYYGIESANESVLGKVSKGITPSQTAKTIALSRKHRIKTMGFIMLANPGDTLQTIKQTLRFCKAIKLDFIQVGRTIPKPFSELHLETVKVLGRDFWRDYILYKIPEIRAPTPWTSFSHKQQEELVRMFYKNFYYRPSYIINRLMDVRSFEELKRYARAGWHVLFSSYRDYRHS